MSTISPFEAALARLRDVFVVYQKSPGILPDSLELEDCTRDAARAALADRIPFASLCAELGRTAIEGLRQDRLAAIGVGRVMTERAAQVYYRHTRAKPLQP